MANEEHLDILKQGIEVWNQWRQEHSDIQPDLSKSQLPNIDLGMTFHYGPGSVSPERRFIDLSRCDLNNTNLVKGNLYGANLSNAILWGSNLSRADLREANLSKSNLTDVRLNGTDLTGANLKEADLNRSILGMTIFGDVNLSEALGLERTFHEGPSIIGISALYRSQGSIPTIFLKRVGVPDSLIETIPALIGALQPIDFYSCFISYSSQNSDFAQQLYSDLQNNGVRCWFAPHDMRTGDKIRHRIDESIHMHDKLLLILSEYSISSYWVEHEVETALGKEQEGYPNVLFPIRLDDTVLESRTGWAAYVKHTRHIGDFTRWKHHDDYQQAFQRLLHNLKAASK